MGYLNILDFNFDSILIFLKKLGIKIIQAPMKLLSKLPSWSKYLIFCLILAAAIAISIWWWKNREEWRNYKSI